MKKILFIIAAMPIMSCSKEHQSVDNNASVEGRWSYIGIYDNGSISQMATNDNSLQIISFNSNQTYVFSNGKDSLEWGNYSFGHKNADMLSGATDSVLLQPSSDIDNIGVAHSQFYRINKDSLFLLPNPSSAPYSNYVIPVYIKK